MLGRLFKRFRIDTHSVAFDVDEHRYERHLYFVKEMFGSVLFQFFSSTFFSFSVTSASSQA